MRLFLINKNILLKRGLSPQQLPLKNGAIFVTESEDFTPLPHFYSAKEVFVLGGDGTLNSVAHKIRPEQVLVPVPLGTGNDFAKKLGYPSNWRKTLLHFLKKREIKWKEVKTALLTFYGGERLVLNSVGYGLDTVVNESKGKNYTAKFLSSQKKIRTHKFILHSNSLHTPRELRTEWLLISLGPFIGGGFQLHDPHLIYDSLLITVFKNFQSPLSRLWAYGKWLIMKQPPFSQQFTATEVEIIPPYKLKPVVDGTPIEAVGKVRIAYPHSTLRVAEL